MLVLFYWLTKRHTFPVAVPRALSRSYLINIISPSSVIPKAVSLNHFINHNPYHCSYNIVLSVEILMARIKNEAIVCGEEVKHHLSTSISSTIAKLVVSSKSDSYYGDSCTHPPPRLPPPHFLFVLYPPLMVQIQIIFVLALFCTSSKAAELQYVNMIESEINALTAT